MWTYYLKSYQCTCLCILFKSFVSNVLLEQITGFTKPFDIMYRTCLYVQFKDVSYFPVLVKPLSYNQTFMKSGMF